MHYQRGVVILTAMIILFIVSSMGVFVMQAGILQYKMSTNFEQNNVVYQVARNEISAQIMELNTSSYYRQLITKDRPVDMSLPVISSLDSLMSLSVILSFLGRSEVITLKGNIVLVDHYTIEAESRLHIKHHDSYGDADAVGFYIQRIDFTEEK
jgi:hypothetical protein